MIATDFHALAVRRRSMTILAIYTTGDTRPLQRSGRVTVPNQPSSYSELYRRRAHELAGSGGVVMGFASRQAFFDWCALPANDGRFDDVRFVGHGSQDTYHLAVTVQDGAMAAAPAAMLNVATYANEVGAALNRIMRAGGSGWGAAGSVSPGLNVDFEACQVAERTLQPIANSIARQTGAPTTVAGYNRYVVTRWVGRQQATAIRCANTMNANAPQLECNGRTRVSVTSSGN
jgi:hypothetical protein